MFNKINEKYFKQFCIPGISSQCFIFSHDIGTFISSSKTKYRWILILDSKYGSILFDVLTRWFVIGSLLNYLQEDNIETSKKKYITTLMKFVTMKYKTNGH